MQLITGSHAFAYAVQWRGYGSQISHYNIKLDHSKYLDTVLHQAKIHLGYQELKLEILIDHSDQSDFSS